MKCPPLPNNIGKIRKWKTINGRPITFVVNDEICFLQSTNQKKAVYLQKMWCEAYGSFEYRLGYYMIGVKPGMCGKWVWGQYATILPAKDFKKIMREAKRRGYF